MCPLPMYLSIMLNHLTLRHLSSTYRFDVAGAGACLKRYTDPSFFKVEWASSELMKAQRAQRDKKARREKVCQSCMISFFGSDLEESVSGRLSRS